MFSCCPHQGEVTSIELRAALQLLGYAQPCSFPLSAANPYKPLECLIHQSGQPLTLPFLLLQHPPQPVRHVLAIVAADPALPCPPLVLAAQCPHIPGGVAARRSRLDLSLTHSHYHSPFRCITTASADPRKTSPPTNFKSYPVKGRIGGKR